MPTRDELIAARNAIGGIESSNRYGITGPATRGDVPLGRYQVMASNLPSWSMAALGRQVSPQEFLSNSDIQDAIFDHRFGQYIDKHGFGGAARAWFGGEGAVGRHADGRQDVLGTTVANYEKKFMAALGRPQTPSFDASSLSDDDIRKELGLDVSSLSDDDIRKELGLEAVPVKKDSYALSEVPGAAVANFPADAATVGSELKALGSAVVNDPLGVAKNVGQNLYGAGVAAVLPDITAITRLFGGDVKKIEEWAKRQGAGKNPMQPIADIIDKPGQVYEDLKKDVAERPAHAALDAATLAVPGGGGAGRAALKTATGTVNTADKLLAPTVGRVLTGVSGDLQREATRAGIAGGREAAGFRGQLRGTAPVDDVVRVAGEAEDAINARGIADRNATIAAGAGSNLPANTGGRLSAAVQAARQQNRDVAGIVQNAEIEGMLNAIQRHIDEAFPNGAPRNAAVLSVDGMDALKRRIGDTLSEAGAFRTGGAAGRVGGSVYNEVKQAITDAFPDYAPGMARAEQNITNLQQIQRQLSLNSQNRATTAGKLQQAARNDAHGGYGMRREALEQLRQERPELVPMLAGQALNSMSPRGIAPWLAMGHGFYGNFPAMLAQYIASIPRLHGEVRYGVGSTIRGARQVGATQQNIGNLIDALRLAAEEEADTEKKK